MRGESKIRRSGEAKMSSTFIIEKPKSGSDKTAVVCSPQNIGRLPEPSSAGDGGMALFLLANGAEICSIAQN